MDASTTKKPKTMAELLPGLSGILSKDAMQTLTAKKQPRTTIANTRTAEKVTKPLTIAEMRADILALKVQSPRRFAQTATSTKTRNWNSSVKVENKTVSHTSDGQMKHNPVRKVLNFQAKQKPVKTIPAPRVPLNPETPKFPKPEFRAKKSLHLQARNNVRISGICNIQETPVVTYKPVKNRMTLANKENISNQSVIKKKVNATPISTIHKIPIPDTPLSNGSWKSSCDASFLQNEKDIEYFEDKTKALVEENTLDKIAEVSPPMSTPFKEYRNFKEYFNNSSEMDSSAVYNDNTIMSFDEKPPNACENNKREESVIVSLCDMLNKATFNTTEKSNTELENLLEVEKQTENNIKMIENGIKTLNNIRESQLKSLQCVRKLISEKKCGRTTSQNDTTLIDNTKDTPKVIKTEKISPETSPIHGKPCSVIKSNSKSPSYKIPKKNACLRKKVFYKSMPNVTNGYVTPTKDIGDRALDMYMKMKEHMNFLNTPLMKQRNLDVPVTPAATSHNLQKQLDKLYGES